VAQGNDRVKGEAHPSNPILFARRLIMHR